MDRLVKAVIFGLFFGAIVAITLGPAVTAVAPETARWMEWAICLEGSHIEHDAYRYSEGGETGVEYVFFCVPDPKSELAQAHVEKNAFVVMMWMSLFYLVPAWVLGFLLFVLGGGRRRRARQGRS